MLRVMDGRGHLLTRFKQKPLPLATPAALELRPGQHIQVTLLDANHCPGAVMFRECHGLNTSHEAHSMQ